MPPEELLVEHRMAGEPVPEPKPEVDQEPERSVTPSESEESAPPEPAPSVERDSLINAVVMAMDKRLTPFEQRLQRLEQSNNGTEEAPEEEEEQEQRSWGFESDEDVMERAADALRDPDTAMRGVQLIRQLALRDAEQNLGNRLKPLGDRVKKLLDGGSQTGAVEKQSQQVKRLEDALGAVLYALQNEDLMGSLELRKDWIDRVDNLVPFDDALKQSKQQAEYRRLKEEREKAEQKTKEKEKEAEPEPRYSNPEERLLGGIRRRLGISR